MITLYICIPAGARTGSLNTYRTGSARDQPIETSVKSTRVLYCEQTRVKWFGKVCERHHHRYQQLHCHQTTQHQIALRAARNTSEREMAPKRRLSKRVKQIGAQVEASIREDGEDHKFQTADSEQLFQIDAKGGDDQVLSKKQKLLLMQKDPLLKSRKFKTDKASKFEIEAVKKIKALQEQEQKQPGKAVSTTPTAAVSLQTWGQDGTIPAPKAHTQLDEYVAPAVIKKNKRRKLLAPTEHKITKVEVAAPGQSYHPEFAAHQDVMAEAVAKELERQDIRKEMSKPVAAGMSEETLQYIDTRGSVCTALLCGF